MIDRPIKCSVFMEDESRCLSTIRAIVERVMIELGEDNSDWRLRDKLIVASAPLLKKHEDRMAELESRMIEAPPESPKQV